MKKLFLVLSALGAMLCLDACKTHKPLLPNVSGKAGEVLVVIEKPDWEGALGDTVRSVLARDCEYLAQAEVLYSLSNVTHGGFGDLFKVHRNIVFFDIRQDAAAPAVSYLHDVWATPQCVISISAADASLAASEFLRNSETIVSAIEQAERDRVVANSIKYEEKDIAAAVRPLFGGSPHFPFGYKLRKATENFVWIADDKQYSTQGIFVYSYPAAGDESDFSPENIITRRNEILRNNVPGMVEGSYMTTSKAFDTDVKFIRYRGRSFAQTRGMWEVEGDFMGGPFVSHSFYSPDGQNIIVLDAWVYAPRYDKRQYLRQVESILYSWETETKQ